MIRPKVYRCGEGEWMVRNQEWDGETCTWTKSGKLLAEFAEWEHAITFALLVVISR
jgi:hypothetical protein